jgi:hypothetical protein
VRDHVIMTIKIVKGGIYREIDKAQLSVYKARGYKVAPQKKPAAKESSAEKPAAKKPSEPKAK